MTKLNGNGAINGEMMGRDGVVLSAKDLDMIAAYKYKPGVISVSK